MSKKIYEEILKNDIKIIKLSQKKALEILSSSNVAMPALTATLKESIKRISEVNNQEQEEKIFIEIINFKDEQDTPTTQLQTKKLSNSTTIRNGLRNKKSNLHMAQKKRKRQNTNKSNRKKSI